MLLYATCTVTHQKCHEHGSRADFWGGCHVVCGSEILYSDKYYKQACEKVNFPCAWTKDHTMKTISCLIMHHVVKTFWGVGELLHAFLT
jgi:hypothetical protein